MTIIHQKEVPSREAQKAPSLPALRVWWPSWVFDWQKNNMLQGDVAKTL